MQDAFAEYAGVLVVPSSAHAETVVDVRAAMVEGGAVLAFCEGKPVGSARFRIESQEMYVGRVAVLPTHRRRGVASEMMRFLENHATALGRDAIRIAVRESLPGNVAFYRALGFEIVAVKDHPRGPDREYGMRKLVRR
jgi:ribosomal protein S18 acetylase RimI-like enzyme